MKYIKKLRTATVFGLMCLMLSSCTDWLTVDPEDQILEDQAFSTETNVQITFNGLYLKMAEEDLYGFQLTSGAVDVLGQYYNIPGSASSRWWYVLKEYTATDNAYKERFEKIWKAAYNLILDINLFLDMLDRTDDAVIIDSHRNILKGEAYAMRAYVHLDMLRLFGPVYSRNPEGLAIPYYRKAAPLVQQRLTAEEAITEILLDLDEAIKYLDKDPVRTDGVMVDEPGGNDVYKGDFYTYRNRRLNYYAVQALKARALMWKGDKTAAAELAAKLLVATEVPEKFPWITVEELNHMNLPDRIFSMETLFGIHSYNMYEYYIEYFQAGILQESQLLAASRTNVNYWFNVSDYNTSNDYRARRFNAYKDPAYVRTDKFAPIITSLHTDVLFFQPLIRKTELYYILAEANGDLKYLDEVRKNRGLLTFGEMGTSPAVNTEVAREHMLEFMGEGQLFYYYKRMYMTRIRLGTTGGNLTMDDSKYVVPLPQKELNQ